VRSEVAISGRGVATKYLRAQEDVGEPGSLPKAPAVKDEA